MDVFKRYITNYVANMSTDCISNLKLIYLPRNSRENYIVNEREEPFVPEITDLVIKKGGTVIDTYNINNISVQMALIQSASTIIVHYGSAFFVNCIHLKNKKIILLDSPVSVNQERAFDSIRYIHEYIKSRNTVFCIFSYTTDIKNILDRLVE
jgi:adenylate kinase family enzyme